MDEYITELAARLMQESNAPMWVYGIKQRRAFTIDTSARIVSALEWFREHD